MKIVKYQARNILHVDEIEWDLQGRHLFLVGGKNGAGKTSALTGLLMALCGRSGMDWPEVALKEGQRSGWVKVNLADDAGLAGLSVELYMRRKPGGQVAEQFRVLDAAGKAVTAPRELLAKLYRFNGFDPLAFDRQSPASQKKTLEDLLGLDFADLNAQHRDAYADRTAVNRELKRLEARQETMPLHPESPTGASVPDLIKERTARVEAHNQRRIEMAAVTRYAEKIADAEAEIDRVKRQLTTMQAEQKARMFNHKEQKIRVDKLPVPLSVNEIDDAIASADETNRRARENEEWEAVQAEIWERTQASEGLTEKLEGINQTKVKALAEAKWPIEGLDFDEDGLLWQGLPLKQAARSVRTLVSCQIGMALNPDLRLLVCEDGSDLDADSLAELEKLLKKKDFQMILELVTRTGEDEDRCAVVVEDGSTKDA